MIFMWAIFALLSAVFAALTSIFAKIGIENVNSNLATAIRTVVVLVMAWGIVLMTGKLNQLPDISSKSWIFLILSGLATGLSWLCYFYALQIGEASKVVPVDKFSVVITMVMAFFLLGETVTVKTIIGGILVGTSRTVAAEFTFFLGIPVMFGASLLKLLKFGFGFTGTEVLILVIGMVVAFVVSILAIKFLMGYIKKHDFKAFGWYRIVLGVLVLVYFIGKTLLA